MQKLSEILWEQDSLSSSEEICKNLADACQFLISGAFVFKVVDLLGSGPFRSSLFAGSKICNGFYRIDVHFVTSLEFMLCCLSFVSVSYD